MIKIVETSDRVTITDGYRNYHSYKISVDNGIYELVYFLGNRDFVPSKFKDLNEMKKYVIQKNLS